MSTNLKKGRIGNPGMDKLAALAATVALVLIRVVAVPFQVGAVDRWSGVPHARTPVIVEVDPKAAFARAWPPSGCAIDARRFVPSRRRRRPAPQRCRASSRRSSL